MQTDMYRQMATHEEASCFSQFCEHTYNCNVHTENDTNPQAGQSLLAHTYKPRTS
jgi:hypothetical protein